MASHSVSSLRRIPLPHWPTMMLLIGYIVFWVELYVIKLPFGHTSCLAWLLSLIGLSIFAVFPRLKFPLPVRLLGGIVLLLMAVYLGIVIEASSRPVHLIQEYDALNYHLSIPRQHLLVHHFKHLIWSSADLYLLPIDYALAPFCLVTKMPNKWPMLFFAFGLMAMVYHLVKDFAIDNMDKRAQWAMVGLLGYHVLMIQLGTAMLDVVIAYCFFACWHSLRHKYYGLAAIEAAFFLASKPFIFPPMILLLLAVMGVARLFIHHYKWQMMDQLPWNAQEHQRFLFLLIGVLGIVALPGMIKSLMYAGTPLFPFGVGILKPIINTDTVHWQNLVDNAKQCLQIKDSYGHGTGFMAFIQHWWLIAVPEHSVNNAYDYPVGLVYLLMWVPLIGIVMGLMHYRKFFGIIVIMAGWWTIWWFTSQQTRFLLIPLIAMLIIVMARLPRINGLLKCLLTGALLIETISLIGAHRADWGRPDSAIIRPQDLHWMNIDLNKGPYVVYEPDVAYAPVPVEVKGKSVFIIDN